MKAARWHVLSVFIILADFCWWILQLILVASCGLVLAGGSGMKEPQWLQVWLTGSMEPAGYSRQGLVMFKMSHRVSASCENNLASLAKIWLRWYAQDSTGALIHCDAPVQSWQHHDAVKTKGKKKKRHAKLIKLVWTYSSLYRADMFDINSMFTTPWTAMKWCLKIKFRYFF